MEHIEFKNLMNHLIDVGLHFEPKDLNKLFRVWYPVLNKYSDQELKNAVSNWLLNKKEFPTLSELLLEIEKNRLGIGNPRLYLVRKKHKKEKMLAEAKEKIANIQADNADDLISQKKEIRKDIQNVFPPAIKECVDSFGGNIDDILKYNIKEFSLMITQQLHKKIEKKAYKMLEKK